ncbi:MAG: hypothetical protein AAF805_15140 [Planctomycetota bacterium]
METWSIADLWLPIVVTGLATHVLSTLAWTVSPHHNPEWSPLPMYNDLDTLFRERGVERGTQYLLSLGAEADRDPAKCRGMLILWGHKPSMGSNIAMTLAFFFAAAVAIAYLASIGLPKSAPPVDVFRFTATVAFLTHAAAGVPTVVWFRRKFLMDFLDGVAYSLATGAAFTAFWPGV